MASPEQIELSTFIKNTHSDLRVKSKEIGYDKAWKHHCENKEILTKYSECMKKLATEHWERSEDSKTNSRIEWVYNYSNIYFFGEELKRQRQREIDVLGKSEIKTNDYTLNDKLKLLDVGSCYNPFKVYSSFEVTAVDIAPGCEEVSECDFLNLNINDSDEIIDGKVYKLEKTSFDVVVFSLLLEYLPSPEQRLECCQNAYKLLKREGILVIITPDSKHVSANANYMKSWRFALSFIGFSRIKYEKLPYLHCMVFRKSLHEEFAKRWADLNKNRNILNAINIPQDFQDKETNKEKIET